MTVNIWQQGFMSSDLESSRNFILNSITFLNFRGKTKKP